MGMSGDYEAAIAMGSTNVRVGSSIFGAFRLCLRLLLADASCSAGARDYGKK